MAEELNIKGSKSERVMELLFKALKGEALSAQKLALEYNVSTRSITRDIDSFKCFMAERPEIFYGAELIYSPVNHSYTLTMDTLLSNKELIAIAKILVGSRALSREELITILGKLESNTSPSDRSRLLDTLRKEISQYKEPASDCPSVIENIWKLSECIEKHRLISIYYYRMDRHSVEHRLYPVSIMFSEGYFYLIAYRCDKEAEKFKKKLPLYFRADRITQVKVHRELFIPDDSMNFDEGYLRNRSQFMWPGPLRHIKFEFTGPSVQAILDKIPTAKIISRTRVGRTIKYTIEAETYGNGIKMFLLSQGAWVKLLEPEEFVETMKSEIEKMKALYR